MDELREKATKEEEENRMNADTHKDVWQLIEEAPQYAEGTADLYHWSTNYDSGKGPFTLFLDLIGWSDEQIGEPLYNMREMLLGYVELGKLAKALAEYSNRPSDIMEFVNELLQAESAD